MLLPEISEIRGARKALGMSQTALSELSGIPQSVISKAERGESRISYAAAKLLFELLDSKRGRGTGSVEKFMNKRVVSVESDAPAERIIKIMRDRGISQLPVFRGGVAVGSISERVLLEASVRFGREALSRKQASEIMGPPFPVVPEGTGIEDASEFLKRFSAVLISSREGRVSGILTRSDLLRR
ncbi:MAG: CBS domain-containing protein [archaeon]